MKGEYSINDFLKEVYRLDALGEYEVSRFKILYHMQLAIYRDDFLFIHRILNNIKAEKLSPSSIRTFLATTLWYEAKCPARAELYKKVIYSGKILPSTEWFQKLKPRNWEEGTIR